MSGKAGVGIPVTDALSAYGEVEIITAEDEFLDDLGVGGKPASSTTSDIKSGYPNDLPKGRFFYG